jgi:hypothetical protein
VTAQVFNLIAFIVSDQKGTYHIQGLGKSATNRFSHRFGKVWGIIKIASKLKMTEITMQYKTTMLAHLKL